MGKDRKFQTNCDISKETLHIGRTKNTMFNFLGLKLNQTNEGITVDQYDYIRSLEMIKIDPSKERDLNQSLTLIETDLLQSKIGQLLWINNQTRPDIGFEVCQIASNLKNTTIVNKIIKRLHETQYHLTYRPIRENHKIVLFTNASFGNHSNGGCHGAQVIYLVGDDNTCNLISWQSKRIKRVTKSSLTAENFALSDGVDSPYYISTLFAEIMYGNTDIHKLPIEAYVDDKNLIDALKSTKFVTDKRLPIDISTVEEMISNKQIKKVEWIPTNKQLANCLTKQGFTSDELLLTLQNGKLTME